MTHSQRPILVAGGHRTGTTWVGKMLAADNDIAYISEPLNVMHRPGVFRAPVKHWYTYINRENESEYLPAFNELLDFDYHLWDEIRSIRSRKDFLRMGRDFHIFYVGNLHGQRALLKDPFAVFSLPWFAEKLNCQIVVTARHPAAFASSLKRLGWSFDFNDLLAQPLLMRDHLEPFRADMQSVAADDVIGQAALLWNMIYRFVRAAFRPAQGDARERTPSIQLVRHEDLSLDPIAGYRKLYGALDLNFTPRVERTILKSSSSENPAELSKKKTHSVNLDSRANLNNWKNRLAPDEVDRIRKITEETAHDFYPDINW